MGDDSGDDSGDGAADKPKQQDSKSEDAESAEAEDQSEKQSATAEAEEVADEDTESADEAQPQLVEFQLPEVAEGIESVDIAEVLVSAGDTIEANAVICEVETDKAVAEINCPHAGTIKEVHVASGDSVKIGANLVSIETRGGGQKSKSAKKPAAKESESGKDSKSQAAVSSGPTSKTERDSVHTAAPTTSLPKDGDKRPPAPAGPATRRLARKLGVDLHQVKGSAKGGRITIEDLEDFVRDRLSKPAAAAGGAAQTAGLPSVPPLPDFSKFGPVEKESLNKIARTSATNLHGAWLTIPHVTQHDLADITELEAARKRYVKANPKSPKITMTAVMIKAVVGALKAFPKVNSSIDLESGELIIKKYYHIGVAVDTPNGLVVPVIRNCDQKNVLQVADELTDIAVRARDRKLKTEEMQGASFTITNLGGIGGTSFTPIVNYPEVAILGMSRGQKQLALEDGQVTEKLMLPLSLSYDHRALNGADAARFIVKLSGSLTNFFELF